ncbi:hypothetical protein [Mesoflavibacter sp. SCSIO 43206]|uniref:hypothetical protein n=1 Tax=Mesoflavibacter sp. SCSIO 43206 TaxID=2779362 RepID=UPI001CA7D4AB|nr:hypothetical protein [Mesoflavibacter sp. SCSIO 43206]UAB74315.1 hypothetical protein INR78_07870 [Mesoflavibacter sp. SCSIO 43206]
MKESKLTLKIINIKIRTLNVTRELKVLNGLINQKNHPVNNDKLSTEINSINKGLKILSLILSKKKHESLHNLIEQVRKDDKLYVFLRKNTKKNNNKKFTINSLLKSLTTLNKDINIQNKSNLTISTNSVRNCLRLLFLLIDKKEQKLLTPLTTLINDNNDLYQYIHHRTRSLDNKKLLSPKNILKSMYEVLNEVKKEKDNGIVLRKKPIKKKKVKIKEEVVVEEITKKDCDKVYFTWKNLIFTNRGIKVDPNILYLSISIDGPTNILNQLSETYFQKKYANELYKVYINKSTRKIVLNLSTDIDKIRDIVINHVNNVKKTQLKRSQIKKETKENKQLSFSKEINLNEIKKKFKSNTFIIHASKFIKNKNKAIALWENNNSSLEEALLIIIKKNRHNFVIWENINENRACYIFKFNNINFNKKLNNLKKFINSNVEYKRYDLFANNGKANKLNYLEYYTVTHEDINTYKSKLNTILRSF